MNYQIKYLEHQGVVEYMEIFGNVLSGKVKKDSASGNSCSFEVDKDNTVIEFLYTEDENETEICTVNTRRTTSIDG